MNCAYFMSNSDVERKNLVRHPADQNDDCHEGADLRKNPPAGRDDSSCVAVARDSQRRFSFYLKFMFATDSFSYSYILHGEWSPCWARSWTRPPVVCAGNREDRCWRLEWWKRGLASNRAGAWYNGTMPQRAKCWTIKSKINCFSYYLKPQSGCSEKCPSSVECSRPTE